MSYKTFRRCRSLNPTNGLKSYKNPTNQDFEMQFNASIVVIRICMVLMNTALCRIMHSKKGSSRRCEAQPKKSSIYAGLKGVGWSFDHYFDHQKQ